MTSSSASLIDALAHRRGIHLPPGWATGLAENLALTDADYPDRICAELGWPSPVELKRKPKAHQFPLLVFAPDTGWCLAEQWQNSYEIRTITPNGVVVVPWSDDLRIVHVPFPASSGRGWTGSAFGIFKSALLRRKKMLIDAGIATVVINVIALATSVFSMQVYDRVIPRGGFSTLWVLTAGMAIAILVDFLIRISRSTLMDREAANIDGEVSEYFFERMQAIRLDARPNGIGTIAAQMRGLDQVRSLMASATLFVLADLPFAILFIAVMAALGGAVAIVPLLLFPLSLGLAYLFSRLIRDDTAQAQVTSNRKNGLLVEALDATETIKANLGGWHMLAQWNTLVENVDASELRVRHWSTLATTTFALMQQVAYVAIVVVGSYKVGLGELSMGGLIACTIISGRINGPLVGALPNFLIQWGYARSSLQLLDRILEMPSDQPADQQLIKLPETQGKLQLVNAQFVYPGTRTGINIPSLEFAPGERVGIVGPVGSGKSTLMRIIAGLYAPQQGHVLLDGVDVSQIADDDVRRHICYLPQDYRVISGTLRNNLTLGVPDPRDDVLMEAATKSGLIHLINHHPKGLDLPITEGGKGLSGGQRALVGLTRALLVKPKILLLDEPTASLDQENEVRVLQALFNSLGADTTLVLITHKVQLLGTVRRLIVLNEGQIAADGPTKAVIDALKSKAAGAKPQAPENSR